MKKNQILALLLAAVMLLAVLTGCAAKAEPAQDEPAQTETVPETEEAAPAEEEPAPAEEPEAEDTASTVTLTDMTGREITLDAPAERVVALTAADCEILYALGAGDLLVGRGEYCDYPAEVLDVHPPAQSAPRRAGCKTAGNSPCACGRSKNAPAPDTALPRCIHTAAPSRTRPASSAARYFPARHPSCRSACASSPCSFVHIIHQISLDFYGFGIFRKVDFSQKIGYLCAWQNSASCAIMKAVQNVDTKEVSHAAHFSGD